MEHQGAALSRERCVNKQPSCAQIVKGWSLGYPKAIPVTRVEIPNPLWVQHLHYRHTVRDSVLLPLGLIGHTHLDGPVTADHNIFLGLRFPHDHPPALDVVDQSGVAEHRGRLSDGPPTQVVRLSQRYL